MKNEALIRSLVAEMRPVRRLPSARLRALLWACSGLGCVYIGACAFGLRADLARWLRSASCMSESGLLLVVFALSAYCVFGLGVPGMTARTPRWLPVLGTCVWVGSIVARGSTEPPVPVSGAFIVSGLACVGRTACLAILPTLSLAFMLRRAAPLEQRWTTLLSVLSTSSLALIGTGLVCARDAAAHVLTWHAVPLLAAGLAGVAWGRALLGKRRALGARPL